jgi:hypothetical protein
VELIEIPSDAAKTLCRWGSADTLGWTPVTTEHVGQREDVLIGAIYRTIVQHEEHGLFAIEWWQVDDFTDSLDRLGDYPARACKVEAITSTTTTYIEAA